MLNADPEIATLLHLWGISFFILLVTGAVAYLFRRSVYLISRDRFTAAQPLIPVISNLIYLLGLKLIIDSMPLTAKAQLWADHLLFVAGTLLLLWILRKAAILGIEISSQGTRHSAILAQGFIPLVKNFVTLFIVFTGIIMVLRRFNYDVWSLLTALGVGSLAVGLAAKDTLSNMISGFTLIIDRNLRPGDYVNLTGVTGQVEEIGLRSTTLRTGDGNALIVPNSELVNTKILNLSQPTAGMSVVIAFKIPYGTSFTQVRSICIEVVRQNEAADPNRECTVNLALLGESLQTVEVTFWIRSITQRGAAISDFNEKLLFAFQKNSIPLAAANPVAVGTAPTAP